MTLDIILKMDTYAKKRAHLQDPAESGGVAWKEVQTVNWVMMLVHWRMYSLGDQGQPGK